VFCSAEQQNINVDGAARKAMLPPALIVRKTASQAWDSICRATKQIDPLHQADMLRTLVSFQARRATRVVGGMTAIARRDRYTATKMRVAFVEAFEAGGKVGAGC